MTTVQFELSAIERNKRYRPEGYYEDVVSRGEIHGNCVVMDIEQAKELIEKYYERNPLNGLLVDKSEWGPILWSELHNRTEQYEMDEEAELRWLGIFTSWVPCGECRKHFVDIQESTPPDLSSKAAYKKWAIDVHNIVNKSLGKSEFDPSSSNNNGS